MLYACILLEERFSDSERSLSALWNRKCWEHCSINQSVEQKEKKRKEKKKRPFLVSVWSGRLIDERSETENLCLTYNFYQEIFLRASWDNPFDLSWFVITRANRRAETNNHWVNSKQPKASCVCLCSLSLSYFFFCCSAYISCSAFPDRFAQDLASIQLYHDVPLLSRFLFCWRVFFFLPHSVVSFDSLSETESGRVY